MAIFISQIFYEHSFISLKKIFITYWTIFKNSYRSLFFIIINSILLSILFSNYIDMKNYHNNLITIISIITTLFITISSILSIVPSLSCQKNEKFFELLKQTNAINIFCIILCIIELSLSFITSCWNENPPIIIITYLQFFLFFFIFYHVLITAKRLFTITIYTISMKQEDNTD